MELYKLFAAAVVHFLIPGDSYRYGVNKEVVAMVLPKQANARNGKKNPEMATKKIQKMTTTKNFQKWPPTLEFHPLKSQTDQSVSDAQAVKHARD